MSSSAHCWATVWLRQTVELLIKCRLLMWALLIWARVFVYLGAGNFKRSLNNLSKTELTPQCSCTQCKAYTMVRAKCNRPLQISGLWRQLHRKEHNIMQYFVIHISFWILQLSSQIQFSSNFWPFARFTSHVCNGATQSIKKYASSMDIFSK
jgi:hypothetical protein